MSRQGIEVNPADVHTEKYRNNITDIVVFTTIFVVNLLNNQLATIPETQGKDRSISKESSYSPDDRHFLLERYRHLLISSQTLAKLLQLIVFTPKVLYSFYVLENLEDATVKLD